MKKEQFLELASQLFDQTNPVVNESLIPLDKNVFDEIVDQISSELSDSGTGIVDDYELGMSGREVELESIDFNHREVLSLVSEVLGRYFEVK